MGCLSEARVMVLMGCAAGAAALPGVIVGGPVRREAA